MRNATAATGAKKPSSKGKNNLTVAVNNTSTHRTNGENSMREASVETSKRRIAGEPSARPDAKKKAEAAKHICLLNSSISKKPVAVNINIRSHEAPGSTTHQPKGGKKPAAATAALSNVSSAKYVSPVGALVSKMKSPKKVKPTSPAAKIGTKKLGATAKAQQPKTSATLMQLQTLLKSAAVNKSSGKVVSKPLATTRNKKVSPADSSKKALATTSISVPKKSPAASQSILVEPAASKEPAQKSKLFPMGAAQALRLYSIQMTDFERGEIFDYETVYYYGNGMAKGGENGAAYDDDKGDYNTYVGEQIGYRYEIIDILGKGSFGQVLKCFDHKDNQQVALKIIRSKKRFYHQATVEVKILKYIREHDPDGKSNMVRMFDYFVFRKHIVFPKK